MGLTFRLFLLCVVVLLPAVGIQAYTEIGARGERVREVNAQALQSARLAASEIDRILSGVQNLLIAVAKEPSIRDLDTQSCVPYLAALRPEVPYLLSISAIDRNGDMRCRQSMTPTLLNLADRSYFQEAMAGAPLVVGEFTRARTSNVPVLPVAIPLEADDGSIDGVVVAAIDLGWLTAQMNARGVPQGGSVTVADRNGVILAREPLPARFVGTKIPADFLHLVTAPAPGAMEVISQDGTRRILGYVPIASPPQGLYISAGLSYEQSFAGVNAATRNAAILIGAALLLALLAAWAAGRVFIKRPVDKLLRAVEAWGSGDLGSRTGLGATPGLGGGELHRIGLVFDRVAAEVQRRAEALQETEERSRLAIEATGIGIWDVDAATGARRWSPEMKAITGLSADAPADAGVFASLIHPDDRDRVNGAYREAYRPGSGGYYEAEFRFRRANDGVERWLVTNGRVTFGPDGQPLRGIGTIRDVTERRRAESALRESEARLRALADNLPNGMVYQLTASPDGARRFVYVSEGVERLFGFKAADILADPRLLYGAIAPEDVDRVAAVEAQAIREGGPFAAEVRMRGGDGAIRWFQLASAPRAPADGPPVWDGVAIDITQRKIAEQALRVVNETLEHRVEERTAELAAANAELVDQIDQREKVETTLRQMQRLEAVGQLTSGVAHDFNNLLTVILGNLSFLERALTDDSGRRRISMMRSAAERGANLTSQLLAFSRRQKLEPQPVDLNDTVAGMEELLRSTLGGALSLEVRLTPDLPAALVDPTQIELVILNLAINARDAMQVGGTLTVETRREVVARSQDGPEGPPPGAFVVVSVADTGAGMTDEVLAKAFEPFFTTKDVGKGSGLGLAQVYGFAKQSGGGVGIATRLGAGTTIGVYLPIAPVRARPAARQAEPLQALERGATILVVDDDPAVREVTCGLLRDLGYAVLEAADGPDALQAFQANGAIDILLVDFAMPRMNGAELAARARALRPGIPILFVTGYADFDALKTVGEENIVKKPFRDGDLSRKLAALLARSARPDIVAAAP